MGQYTIDQRKRILSRNQNTWSSLIDFFVIWSGAYLEGLLRKRYFCGSLPSTG
jgi:hypothetical protein